MEFSVKLQHPETKVVYDIVVNAVEAVKLETDENFRNEKLLEAMAKEATCDDNYENVEWLETIYQCPSESNRYKKSEVTLEERGKDYENVEWLETSPPGSNRYKRPTVTLNKCGKENIKFEESQLDCSSGQFDDSGFRWSHEAILLLIDEYRKIEGVLKKGKISHKKMWANIAEKMKQRGHRVTGPQCQSKFSGMKKTYKSIKDHNQKSGNSARTWPYLTIMDELMGDKPFIKPMALSESDHVRSRTHSESSESSVSSKSERSTKRSKSRRDSVTDELLSTLKVLKEEKDTRHQERQQQRHELMDILKQVINQNNHQK